MSVNERVETVLTDGSTNRRPSTAVALELAEILDRPATEVTPLAESVDPEAIDRLFDGAAPGADVRVSFVHEDCRIELSPSTIDITRQD